MPTGNSVFEESKTFQFLSPAMNWYGFQEPPLFVFSGRGRLILKTLQARSSKLCFCSCSVMTVTMVTFQPFLTCCESDCALPSATPILSFHHVLCSRDVELIEWWSSYMWGKALVHSLIQSLHCLQKSIEKVVFVKKRQPWFRGAILSTNTFYQWQI